MPPAGLPTGERSVPLPAAADLRSPVSTRPVAASVKRRGGHAAMTAVFAQVFLHGSDSASACVHCCDSPTSWSVRDWCALQCHGPVRSSWHISGYPRHITDATQAGRCSPVRAWRNSWMISSLTSGGSANQINPSALRQVSWVSAAIAHIPCSPIP